jgi:AbrB family looped-hinge helix DNA binding protein
VIAMEDRTPIVKYHTRVVKGGRIVIPKSTRELLNLTRGDYIKCRVAKITKIVKKKPVVGKYATISERLEDRGLIVIPKDIREKLGINFGDIVQVEILDYHSSR